MGIGRSDGGGDKAAASSAKEKLSGLGSKLVKFGNDVIGNIKAVFSEMTAKDDKVVVNPPGLKQQEVPDKTVKQLAAEESKLSDVLKIGGLTALALLINNPIPLMFAQRHSANLKARIKAKEKQLNKVRKQVAQAKTKAEKRQKIKNAQDLKSVNAIKAKRDAYEKSLKVTEKRVGVKPATREISAADRKRATSAIRSLKGLGYTNKQAKRAVSLALKRSTAGDINNFTAAVLLEASNMRRSE